MLDARHEPALYFRLDPSHGASTDPHPAWKAAFGFELVDHGAAETRHSANLRQPQDLCGAEARGLIRVRDAAMHALGCLGLNVSEAQTTRHQRLTERSGLRENSGDTRLVREYRLLEEAQLGVESSARQDSQRLAVWATLGHNANSAVGVQLRERDARIGPNLQMCPHRCPICATFRR